MGGNSHGSQEKSERRSPPDRPRRSSGKGNSPLIGKPSFPKVFSVAKTAATLDQAVQGCIVGALKGKPLAGDDARLTDLVA